MPGRVSHRLERVVRRIWLGGTASLLLASVAADWIPGAVPSFGAAQVMMLVAGLLGIVGDRLLGSSTRLALLLAATGIGLSLMLAEVGLRLTMAARFANLYQPNDVWLYDLLPARTTARRLPAEAGGDVFDFAVNAHGLRGPEVTPAAGARRVLVLGDSFIMGEFSRSEDTFAHRLRVELQSSAASGAPSGVQVLNAGISGHGPDQHVARLRERLAALEPDLVIAALYSGNDFGDLFQNGMVREGTGHGLEWSDAQLTARDRQRMLRSVYEPYLVKAARRVVTSFAAPAPTSDPFPTSLEVAREQFGSYQQGEPVDGTLDSYSADVALRPDSESARTSQRLMAGVLAELASFTRARDIPTGVCVIPSGIDVCDEYFLGPVDPHEYPAYRREGLNRRVVAAASAAGLPVLDLLPVFRANQPESFYFRSEDSHWNAAGQRLAAREVADWIVAEGWFSK